MNFFIDCKFGNLNFSDLQIKLSEKNYEIWICKGMFYNTLLCMTGWSNYNTLHKMYYNNLQHYGIATEKKII